MQTFFLRLCLKLRNLSSSSWELGLYRKFLTPGLQTLTEGHKLGEPRPLFSMIPAAKLEEWREAYGGSAIQEQKRLEAEKAAAKKAAKKAKKESEKQAIDEGGFDNF